MSAVLFGSISTLADTSEIQRQAFNEAFEAHGLDWRWSQDDYRALLGSNGGAQRVAQVAKERGDDVDADAVHATKSEIFQKRLAESDVHPRPGVAETIRDAREHGALVALVTTTSRGNLTALLSALAGDLGDDPFDLVTDVDSVEESKPDPAVYRFALDRLGEEADACVAIEDNEGGVRSAVAAGVRCVAFPNENTRGGDFGGATAVVDELVPADVVGYGD